MKIYLHMKAMRRYTGWGSGYSLGIPHVVGAYKTREAAVAAAKRKAPNACAYHHYVKTITTKD